MKAISSNDEKEVTEQENWQQMDVKGAENTNFTFDKLFDTSNEPRCV